MPYFFDWIRHIIPLRNGGEKDECVFDVDSVNRGQYV